MTFEHMLCIAVLVWSVTRAGHMRPCAPLLDKAAVAFLGGAAAAYLSELHMYGSPHLASQLMLAGVALWVLPPSLRCWLRGVRVPRVVRMMIGGDK